MKYLLFILVIFISSCTWERKPQLIIPNETIDKIFTKVIDNPMAEKYNLTKLRETSLSKGDLEIRIWVSIGSEGIDGFVIKRINKNWFAFALKEIDCNRINKDKTNNYQIGKIELSPPKSGWENAWKRLVETEILELPDYDERALIDGFSYLVEINHTNTYRIYRYSSPDYYRTKETEVKKNANIQKMMEIGNIISDEFGLRNFKLGNMCL